MFYRMILIVFFLELIFGSPMSYAKEAAKVSHDPKAKDAPQAEELLTRIDFGNSYVTGQALKSGAIYLLQRKKNKVESMLTYRENYRKEILESHDIRKTEDRSVDKQAETGKRDIK